MLTHKVLGPDAEGQYSVGYPIPGTTAYTLVCGGCSADDAKAEASRLNCEQLAADRRIQGDRKARLRGVPTYPKGTN